MIKHVIWEHLIEKKNGNFIEREFHEMTNTKAAKLKMFLEKKDRDFVFPLSQ